MNLKLIHEFLDCKFSDLSKFKHTKLDIEKGLPCVFNEFIYENKFVFYVLQYEIYPTMIFIQIGSDLLVELTKWFDESSISSVSIHIFLENWFKDKLHNSELRNKFFVD